MSRSLSDKVADKHTMYVGKVYHWAKTEDGKATLHRGLQGKCDKCPEVTT